MVLGQRQEHFPTPTPPTGRDRPIKRRRTSEDEFVEGHSGISDSSDKSRPKAIITSTGQCDDIGAGPIDGIVSTGDGADSWRRQDAAKSFKHRHRRIARSSSSTNNFYHDTAGSSTIKCGRGIGAKVSWAKLRSRLQKMTATVAMAPGASATSAAPLTAITRSTTKPIVRWVFKSFPLQDPAFQFADSHETPVRVWSYQGWQTGKRHFLAADWPSFRDRY